MKLLWILIATVVLFAAYAASCPTDCKCKATPGCHHKKSSKPPVDKLCCKKKDNTACQAYCSAQRENSRGLCNPNRQCICWGLNPPTTTA